MSWIKALCCCIGEDDEDTRHLLNQNDEYERGQIRDSRSHGTGNNYYDDGVDNSSSNTMPKTREQAEEELLRKILENTQQRVIEVSNYEVYTGDVDIAERQAKYQLAVSKHDENKSLQLPISMLLTDSGLDLLDVIKRPGLFDDDLQVLVKWNKSCTNAVKIGLQIEKKEDIVVYMKADD